MESIGSELVTRSFANQCIAFPDKVESMLSKIQSVDDAKGMLDKAAAMQKYAERLKAGIELERPIALGVLKIKAKLGELCPAKPPQVSGAMKGKKGTKAALVPFTDQTLAAYRKIAKHAGKIQEYYDSINDVPTQTDFLKRIKAEQVAAKKSSVRYWKPKSESGVTNNLASLAGLKFGTVYADPPWRYENQGTRASTDNHYGTMSVDELCSLPVKDLVNNDAHLHLWTTNAFLFESRKVMEAWGFEYKSVFVWVKPQMGIGNYWRVAHEFMLLGVRGDAKSFNERNHKSWMEIERKKHSEKPEQVRDIVQSVSNGPFLELFGRKAVPGWTVFGNQINKPSK